MTVLYKLSREQLSKQYHYDFGLRALKSVLVMAGAFKRGDPDMSEQLVLMRALRDMNLPKFVFEDVPLFLGLINDLFPGMDCPRVRYPQFNDVVEQDLAVISTFLTIDRTGSINVSFNSSERKVDLKLKRQRNCTCGSRHSVKAFFLASIDFQWARITKSGSRLCTKN